MRRYFKTINCEERSQPFVQVPDNIQAQSPSCHNVKVQRIIAPSVIENQVLKDTNEFFDVLDMNDLPADPGLRPCIYSYDANKREEVRRAYIRMGPCQPKKKPSDFPWKYYDANTRRRFIATWFNDFSTWLEYSVAKDAAYCLCCYLFKPEQGEQGGGESFVGEGFSNWKDKSRLGVHIGNHNSVHNKCVQACEDLRNHKQHIELALCHQNDEAKRAYDIRLNASIDCIRFLLRQGLAFRGHDESKESLNKGNFLELLRFLANHNEETNKATLSNSPGNLKLVCHRIQKDIVNAFSFLTTQAILKDIGSGLFSILVDESRDISVKEQMALALRYVDQKGCVVECFLGLVHVKDTTALSLKAAVESLLMKHKLSLSNIRGQGYDGASNMSGEFHGLKSLIMAENESAYYVHCFAHQLQLTLVAVVKKHKDVCSFFSHLSSLSNIIGASSKRSDIFRSVQEKILAQAVCDGEIKTGRGLNQERTIKRPGDTRWSSHFGSLISLCTLFSSVVGFLEIMVEVGCSDIRGEANILIEVIHQFEFVFLLHLMKSILGITHDLSQALQKKDQDIVNAMTLVNISKQRLQDMRDDGWETLMNEVCVFCSKHNLIITSMQDPFVVRGRPRRNEEVCTNLHRYKVDLFYSVIDSQLQELNNRFDKKNTDLLLSMACLDPRNSFSTFDKARLIQFAKYYPADFSEMDIVVLENQLENYIYDVRSDEQFSNLKGIGDLAKKLVEVNKDGVYPLVYLLVKLALILPVGTATVERIFSAMKLLKSSLRNKMDDDWMNDCMVTYIEKKTFDTVTNGAVIKQFQLMRKRKLPFCK